MLGPLTISMAFAQWLPSVLTLVEKTRVSVMGDRQDQDIVFGREQTQMRLVRPRTILRGSDPRKCEGLLADLALDILINSSFERTADVG